MRKTVVLLLASLLLASLPVQGTHVKNPAETGDSVFVALHDCTGDGGGPSAEGTDLEALYVGTGDRVKDWDADAETDPDARNLVLFQVVVEQRNAVNRMNAASIQLGFRASDDDANNLPQEKEHTIKLDFSGAGPGAGDWMDEDPGTEDSLVTVDADATSFADVAWLKTREGSSDPAPDGDNPASVASPEYTVIEVGLHPYDVFLHEAGDLAAGNLVLDDWTLQSFDGDGAETDKVDDPDTVDEDTCVGYAFNARTIEPAAPTFELDEEAKIYPVEADPGTSNRDPDSKVTFKTNVDAGGGSPDLDGYTYDWTFVNGDFTTTSTDAEPQIHFPNLDPVKVTLVVTDDLGVSSEPYETEGTEVVMENLPPIADLSIDTQAPVVDQAIAFTDKTTDPDGDPITEWSWDFGDGSDGSDDQNPSHTYAATGAYTVTLTAKDLPPAGFEDQALSSERTFEVFVCTEADALAKACKPPNAGPTANFLVDKVEVDEGETVTFTDTSEDRDGTITAWSWDFGDGTTSGARNPTHVYDTVGTYPVTLTVTDNGGLQGTRVFNVRVLLVEPESEEPKDLLPPPIADFDFGDAIVDEAVVFEDNTTATAKLVAWTWLFGDGSDPEFGSKVEHVFKETGTFRVTLTVEDELGVRDTTSKLVKVGEAPEEESPGLPLVALLGALGVVAVRRRGRSD